MQNAAVSNEKLNKNALSKKTTKLINFIALITMINKIKHEVSSVGQYSKY